MSATVMMCPDDVARLASELSDEIATELDAVNEEFIAEHGEALEEDPSERSVESSRAVTHLDEELRDTLAKLIADTVLVVPVMPNASPWESRKEPLRLAVARFSLLIKDLQNRFPLMLDDDLIVAWRFLLNRTKELNKLLSSFSALRENVYEHKNLTRAEEELRNKEDWVLQNYKNDPKLVGDYLVASNEVVFAWAKQELKQLGVLANASEAKHY